MYVKNMGKGIALYWTIFLGALLIKEIKGSSPDGANELLSSTIGVLAKTAFQTPENAEQQYKLHAPSLEKMAINRLYYKVLNTTAKVRKYLEDPQRKVILERENGGSAAVGILKIFAELRGDIYAMDNAIGDSGVEIALKSMSAIEKGGSPIQRWAETWDLTSKVVGKVNFLYSFFDEYMGKATRNEEIPKDALIDYANSILNPQLENASLFIALEEMHLAFEDDVYDRLHKALHIENAKYMCRLNRSVYDLAWGLYSIVSLTEQKGYLTIAFAFELLREFNFGNYTVEYNYLENVLAVHSDQKMRTIQQLLPELSRMVRRCDPPQQIEGVTYLRLKNLLQGFVANEVDMNPKHSCKKKCDNYQVADVKGCFNQLFCSKQRQCKGRLFDCKFYDADSWVCLSDSDERRYEWIDYEGSVLLGTKDRKCKTKIKVDSWWRWLLYHCSYCVCKCDEPGRFSDRYWSLKSAESDIDSNKIVTGIRFIKKDRLIAMEIQQATALPEGNIDVTTKDWLNFKENIDVSNPVGKDNEYMEMSYEKRAMDIDVLDAPDGHAVTGVRFRSIGGHLNLEIKVTPIDYQTGELFEDGSIWIANDNTPASTPKRTIIDILYPDVPTKFNGSTTILGENNEYVMFDTTTAETDVMQTTIPYIDAQPIETNTWLSGVGVYFKGRQGYAGYVGLSLYNFDFSKNFIKS